MAQTLRERDANMPITLVTTCNGDVHDKPLLSVAIARGMAPEKLPREQGIHAASRLNVKLLIHTQAVRVVPASRQLRTSRGTLHYSSLVMVHGAQARADCSRRCRIDWLRAGQRPGAGGPPRYAAGRCQQAIGRLP